jgi:hypothetical protein
MASFLNRLAKLEEKRQSKTKPRQFVTVMGDESESLEQLQQEWMTANEPDKSASSFDWIHIVFVGVAE